MSEKVSVEDKTEKGALMGKRWKDKKTKKHYFYGVSTTAQVMAMSSVHHFGPNI